VLRGLRALEPSGLSYDKPLCASLDGFTLHAATRAGALDAVGREALLRYVLRPPVAQERVVVQKNGLVAIKLKRAYADGTVAVEMDPLSLLCRLAMLVPPSRFHTVKYVGGLAGVHGRPSRHGHRLLVAPAALPARTRPLVCGTTRSWAIGARGHDLERGLRQFSEQHVTKRASRLR